MTNWGYYDIINLEENILLSFIFDEVIIMTISRTPISSKQLPVVPANKSAEFIKKLNQDVISREVMKRLKETSEKMQAKR